MQNQLTKPIGLLAALRKASVICLALIIGSAVAYTAFVSFKATTNDVMLWRADSTWVKEGGWQFNEGGLL